ncbi:MAG: hypothetical protein ACXV8U_22170 [Methylobacter sp.]
MDNYEKAIKASKEVSSGEGDGHKVINHHPDYLNGALYVVEFKANNGKSLSNYVYIEGSEVTVCKNPALLNEMVARKSRKTGFPSVMDSLGGISGVIGLIVTVTIVYLLVRDPKAEIPQILSTALTAILGFYFGSKAIK